MFISLQANNATMHQHNRGKNCFVTSSCLAENSPVLLGSDNLLEGSNNTQIPLCHIAGQLPDRFVSG